MTPDPLDIPEIFRIPPDVRRASWKGRKLSRQGSAFKSKPTKIEEAATRALRREIEAQERAKAKAKAEAQKEKREADKRRGVKPIRKKRRA